MGTPSIPTGVVTFVITDIVDSTRSWIRHPDLMPDATRRHDEILRSTFERHGGYEFGTAGDSFGVAFGSPTEAVLASAAAQRELATITGPLELGVRIGLSTGTAEERDGRYFGPTVHLAARIGGVAGPGQILVDGPTADAVPTAAIDVELVELGRHPLRSIGESERIVQVVAPGLRSDLVRLHAPRGNLPAFETSFVGRSDEVDSLARSLSPGSLTTLTGLGGLGKSRVAAEAARRRVGDDDWGPWWIDLAPVSTETDDDALAALIATTLGFSPQPRRSHLDALADAIGSVDSLIVLDNCEHVLEPVAGIVVQLRRRCPRIALLATSRRPLRVQAERVVELSPLDDRSARRLLKERAGIADAGTISDDERLTALCRRLDDIPLAIEMVAPRVRLMSPDEVSELLDDRFAVLTTAHRDVPERHTTMHRALSWSFELLDDDERRLLCRSTVMVGSFDLAALDAIAGFEDHARTVEVLASLVDHSLISRVEGRRSTRFRLSETVREFAAAELGDDDRRTLERRMAEFYAGRATCRLDDQSSDDADRFATAMTSFDEDWDALRAAFFRGVRFDEPSICASIMRAVWIFSFQTFRDEVVDWCRRADTMSDLPPVVLARLASGMRTHDETERYVDRALAGIDESLPSIDAALCYSVLYWTRLAAGRHDEAAAAAERGLFHAPSLGPEETSFHHANLAALLAGSDIAGASVHAERALRYVEESKNPLRSTSLVAIARFEAAAGDVSAAYELACVAVEVSAEAGLAWNHATTLATRAGLSASFDLASARDDIVEALTVARDMRAWFAMWLVLGESVDWFTRHAPEVADVVREHVDRRSVRVGAGGSGASDVRRSIRHAQVLRRRELVDRVLEAL